MQERRLLLTHRRRRRCPGAGRRGGAPVAGAAERRPGRPGGSHAGLDRVAAGGRGGRARECARQPRADSASAEKWRRHSRAARLRRRPRIPWPSRRLAALDAPDRGAARRRGDWREPTPSRSPSGKSQLHTYRQQSAAATAQRNKADVRLGLHGARAPRSPASSTSAPRAPERSSPPANRSSPRRSGRPLGARRRRGDATSIASGSATR